MDGSSSVYNRSGTETQHSLTVATQEYDITVRAEACAGSLTAESSVYTVNLTGENNGIAMCAQNLCVQLYETCCLKLIICRGFEFL